MCQCANMPCANKINEKNMRCEEFGIFGWGAGFFYSTFSFFRSLTIPFFTSKLLKNNKQLLKINQL